MPSSPLPPYLTAGASSRAHHALLVRLHDATPQEEDRIVADEVERIQAAMESASPVKSGELLIILLHLSILRKTSESLEFALMKAIELAGGKGKEKSIGGCIATALKEGYLYLGEMMPRDHPLGLLLVNTMRKDLTTEYALLALKAIIQLQLADISPAVTPVLVSKALLKHHEPSIRQRTIQALSKLHLSTSPATFPLSMSRVVRLISAEDDASVLCVLLKLVERMIELHAHVIQAQEREYILQEIIAAAKRVPSSSVLQVATLRSLKYVLRGGREGDQMVEEYIIGQLRLDRWGRAHMLEACHLGTSCELPVLINESFRLVAQCLEMQTPNEHVLALRMLWILSTETWRGRVSDETMGRVMEGINSPDDTIRVITLQLLHMADPSLTQSTYENLLESLRTSEDLCLPPKLGDVDLEEKTRAGLDETALRALEVAEIRTVSRLVPHEPQAFARAVREILVARDERRVWEFGLQRVLELVKNRGLGQAFTDALLADYAADPTLLVMRASLACLYGATDPHGAWRGFQQDLEDPRTTASERELVYVALVALSSHGSIEGAEDALRRERGSKYLEKRRDQVVTVLEHGLAGKVMDQARSRALPDILNAILSVSSELTTSSPPPASADATPSRVPRAPSELRYDAYESPIPQKSARKSKHTPSKSRTPVFKSPGDTLLFDHGSPDASRDEVSGLLDMDAMSGRRNMSSPFFDQDEQV